MILSLHISNIALIEDLTLNFSKGLHVMTGETGAGKSIVVDAVNLVLGGRGDRDLIRTGKGKASVEAVFRRGRPGHALPGNHIERKKCVPRVRRPDPACRASRDCLAAHGCAWTA